MGEKTEFCGFKWFVGDACGLFCAFITWLLVLYGEFCVTTIMLPTAYFYPIHQCLNFIVFNVFVILALTSHLRTMITNPGAVPKNNLEEDLVRMVSPFEVHCRKCLTLRPDRAHHCSVCDRCIRRMDHHCPWVNNCVGEFNQKYFVLFTMYTACLSLHALYWTIWQFATCVSSDWTECPQHPPPVCTLMLIILLFESVLFSIFSGVMFGSQISAICSDETAIESMHGDKTRTRPFRSSWKNLQILFGGPFSLRWFNPFTPPPVHNFYEYSV